MKKVIVVSKTHLDLGFTDYAENIRKKYIDEFIPNAVKTAKSVNTDDCKKFVWTTGSWILKEALHYGSDENKKELIAAIERGDIAPHALPFTTHTELLDEDTMRYGLDLVDEIDSIRGKKTVAAKMTDVPGHTKALVPLLVQKGIKLLHIGVNGASAIPDVPECFLWRAYGAEIVVIYSGEYGGAYKNEFVDDVLYFDHTLDNHGAGGKTAVKMNIKRIQKQYPDYYITAGTLDDYAEEIWQVRDRLPVVTSEIGDTWIHGSAADPYKSGALRTLIGLKNQWLLDGTLDRKGDEYTALADNVLCLAEHTCGMDVKIALGEYKNYLRPDFEKARASKSAYKRIEKSWAEQREYIEKALTALSPEHKAKAVYELKKLLPKDEFPALNLVGSTKEKYSVGDSELLLNNYGGIAYLSINGKVCIENNDLPAVTYTSLGCADYDYWFSHYSRDLDKVGVWAYPDFGKPNIEKIALDYRQGKKPYCLKNLTVSENESSTELLADLAIDEYYCDCLGAPRIFQIKYTLDKDGLSAELLWQDKAANRLPETIMFTLYPNSNSVKYQKIGKNVNPYDVVSNGGRKLSAAEKVIFDDFEIKNYHSPLVSLGTGKILHFDNKYEKLSDGITFVLYDNIWGTNFPLWYSDNAYFKYRIEPTK